jgi:hypothetical protein
MINEEQIWDKLWFSSGVLEANVGYWIRELEEHHDQVEAEMTHEDDYQHGYLHGLRHAIDYLKEKLPDIHETRKEAQTERERLRKGTKDD